MSDDKLVPTKKEARLVVQDSGPLGYLMDTARYQQMQAIAVSMAKASLIPKHLIGQTPQETAANCFLVVNQAIRWGFDPFAVAPETYSPPGSGKLGYQGKLIAGVINARAGLRRRLRYEYSGKGLDRTVKVSGEFEDDPEGEVRVISLSVRQALEGAAFCKRCGDETPNMVMENAWVMACASCKTPNVSFKGKQIRPHHMFRGDQPDQKLMYSAVMVWARRHCPEIVLGMLTREELEISQQSHPVAPEDVELWKKAEPTAIPENLSSGPAVEVTATVEQADDERGRAGAPSLHELEARTGIPAAPPKPKRKRRTKKEMEAARALAEAGALAEADKAAGALPVDTEGEDMDIESEIDQERENWIKVFSAETTREGLKRQAVAFKAAWPEGSALHGDKQLKSAYVLALEQIAKTEN